MMKVGVLAIIGAAAAATEGLVAPNVENTIALTDANSHCAFEMARKDLGIPSKYGKIKKVTQYYSSVVTNDCTHVGGPCPGGAVRKVTTGYEHTDGTSDKVSVDLLDAIITLVGSSTSYSSSTFTRTSEKDVYVPKCTKGKCCWKESPNYLVEYIWGKNGDCSGHVRFQDISNIRPRTEKHCPKNGIRKSLSDGTLVIVGSAAAATEGLVAPNVENTPALTDVNLTLTGSCTDSMKSLDIGIRSQYGRAKVDKFYFSAVTTDCTRNPGPCHGGDLIKVSTGYEHTDGTSDTVTASVLSDIAHAAAEFTSYSESTFKSSDEVDVPTPKCSKGKCCWKESPNYHVEYYWGRKRECSGHVWFKDTSVLALWEEKHCPQHGNRKSLSELLV